MKYWSLLLFFILLVAWIFATVKWIGFKKTNSIKIETTSVGFVSPAPTLTLTEPASQSGVPAASPSSMIYPKVTKAPNSTSSSFTISSPTVSVLRY